MSSLDCCPYCEREAEEAISHNWFPVYTCLNDSCRQKYCAEDGPPCPECGSDDYGEFDKVYAD